MSRDLFRSPSPCRSDARTFLPRRGSAGFSPEPASIVVRWATSCLDVPLAREKGRLASNPGDTGESCSGPLGFPSPTVCHLLWQDQTSPLTILLDSGADESFIDRELVHQLGINTVPLDSPIETQALDGRPLARVERRTVPVNLLISGNHHESISLLVISSPLSPVVLGYPWLKTHNPQIDWATGRVISWSTHCLSHCLR